VARHAPRELDAKMPEAADALDGDYVSTAPAGIAKSVGERVLAVVQNACSAGDRPCLPPGSRPR
jgi:hypothetical protein